MSAFFSQQGKMGEIQVGNVFQAQPQSDDRSGYHACDKGKPAPTPAQEAPFA
jgi:hypothetical protein